YRNSDQESLRVRTPGWNVRATRIFNRYRSFRSSRCCSEAFIGRSNLAAERTQTVKRRLELAGIYEGEALEVFADLLDLPLPDNPKAMAVSQLESRKRLLSMLSNFCLGSSRVQPMVIAVEDLQWADASTVEWIETLAEQGATASLMLLCTSRLDFRE